MRITSQQIYEKKSAGEKIVSVSTYDFPFAKIVDQESVDIVLVGDSLGMVLLGYDATKEVTMVEMLHHSKAVNRAVKRAMVVVDMPYGSYDNKDQAVLNARRLVDEAGADGVKLEGGVKIHEQVKAILQAKIPVMGHVGMTPQSADELGGYRVQGRDEKRAKEILRDAIVLDELGAFSIVLECVPNDLAKKITEQVNCPTIGIGAGPETDGQILVLHDLLGFKSGVSPKFLRTYMNMDGATREALAAFRNDVVHGNYPNLEESYS